MPDSRGNSTRLALLGFVVGIACLGLAVIAIPARATYGARTTADEPQYLTTALSLANDFDLDISDEIAGREFEPFHEITLNQQTFALDESGRRVSPHDPLLPIYLAPFMAAGGWQWAKGGLALLCALTAVITFWVCVRRFDVKPFVAAIVVVGFWAGVPLSGYGTQVYPEMPAALCVIVAVAALVRPGDVTGRGALAVWLCVVCLPWLAVKYALVALALAVVLLVRLPRKRALIVGFAWLLSGLVYLGLHQWIYGGWTVYSTGDHFVENGEFAVVGTDPDYFGRSRRLIGLLVDRKFGIASWHPVWFLAPFAMSWMIVRDRMYALVVAPAFGAGLFTATFVALTMQGWWFPGRQMVVVLPLAVIAVASLASKYQGALLLSVLGAGAGLINWLTLVHEASNDKRTLIVDHWDVEAWPYRLIYGLMPDGLASGAAPDVGLAIWGVLLVMSMATGVSVARRCQSSWALSPSRSEI